MLRKALVHCLVIVVFGTVAGNIVSVVKADDMEAGCKDTFCWNAPWVCRENHGPRCSCGVYWCGS